MKETKFKSKSIFTRWLVVMLFLKPNIMLSLDLFFMDRSVGLLMGRTKSGIFRIRWYYGRSKNLRVLSSRHGYLIGAPKRDC